MIVGATLQASSYSLGQFISGRIITGYEYPIWKKRSANQNLQLWQWLEHIHCSDLAVGVQQIP